MSVPRIANETKKQTKTIKLCPVNGNNFQAILNNHKLTNV